MTGAEALIGIVLAERGGVVDARFSGRLPSLNALLVADPSIPRGGGRRLPVAAHSGPPDGPHGVLHPV